MSTVVFYIKGSVDGVGLIKALGIDVYLVWVVSTLARLEALGWLRVIFSEVRRLSRGLGPLVLGGGVWGET